MQLSNKIKMSVRKAFKKMGDLVADVTLVQKNVTDFNFTTNAVVATTLTTTVTKGILGKETRKESSILKEITLNAEDISRPDIYDKVIIGTDTWTIVEPSLNNGYTIQVTLTKEA